jgi:predicted anti-sigma-YlaC factor YlaD
MTHQEMRLALSAFVDDELPETDRSIVVEHLNGCADCRQWIDRLVTLKRNVHASGDIDFPYAFASTLVRSIHHREEVEGSWLGIEHYALKYALGLALVVLVLVGITSYRQTKDPLPVERYVSGISSDSVDSHILTKQGAITRDDVMFAAFTK